MKRRKSTDRIITACGVNAVCTMGTIYILALLAGRLKPVIQAILYLLKNIKIYEYVMDTVLTDSKYHQETVNILPSF